MILLFAILGALALFAAIIFLCGHLLASLHPAREVQPPTPTISSIPTVARKRWG